MKKLTINTSQYDQEEVVKLLRDRGILRGSESTQDIFSRVIITLLEADRTLNGQKQIDKKLLSRVIEYVESKALVFGTPLLSHVGRSNSVCFASTVVDLQANSNWKDLSTEMSKVLKAGLGVGVDLSHFSHPDQVLWDLNYDIGIVNQQLVNTHKRPVACMATLRADHPRVGDFIVSKQNPQISNWFFNISIWVTEKLISQAFNNSQTKNSNFIRSKSLIEDIAHSAFKCAEPGILYFDRYQRDNPTPQWQYSSVAPCGEMAMSDGEASIFSYINVTHMVKKHGNNKIVFDWNKFSELSIIMTRLMDAAISLNTGRKMSKYEKVNSKRRIGIGITGFAGLLMNLDLAYSSEQAVKLASQLSESLDYWTKVESVRMSRQRGAFPLFKKSKYVDERWLNRKLDSVDPSNLFIEFSEWKKLHQDIMDYGIRNSTTTAFPPTGTSSRVVQATPQFEPCDDLRVIINDKKLWKNVKHTLSHEQLDELSKLLHNKSLVIKLTSLPTSHILVDATKISYTDHILIQSAFQRFADEGISKTISLPSQSSVEDITEAIKRSYEYDLKGLTVFRDQLANFDL